MLTAQMVTPLFINNAGPWGLLLIAIVVLVLFGRGKIAGLMGEVGKGITAFKKGVKDGTEELEDRREADAGTATNAGTGAGTGTGTGTATGTGETARDVTPTPRERDQS